jgi:glycosyltransferase involved in cell wall biosynthesis
MQPLISVIIAVKNGEKTIGKCIMSLLALSYPAVEIIVINDGSTDATERILREFADRITVITTAGEGPSAARNRGIVAANGAYIAFTDGDCIVEPQWLSELFKGFSSEEIAGVGGDQQSPDDDTVFGKELNVFMKKTGFIGDYVRDAGNGIIEVEHNPTCNVLYRTDVLRATGGFLEKLWPGEDVEIDYRLRQKGFRLAFNPRAIVRHYRPETLQSYARMMKRYGAAQAFLVKKYGMFRRIHYVPAATALMMLVIVAGVLFGNVLSIIAGLACCVLGTFIWMLLITRNLAAAARFFRLFSVTLWCWHRGFYGYWISRSSTITTKSGSI